ncbi:MAG: hypothetical protein ACE5RN_04150 [Nitrosopumilaceae archaeon]
MSFRRPKLPKINRRVPKPKKSLRKLKRKSIKPSRISKRPFLKKRSNVKKKKTVKLGVCYSGSNCTGRVLLKKSSKNSCRLAGGKSWRSTQGCQKV